MPEAVGRGFEAPSSDRPPAPEDRAPEDRAPGDTGVALRIGGWSRRLLTPDGFPATSVLIASIAVMLVLAAIDAATADEIRLQVLYVFPLAAIGMHASRRSDLMAGFAIAVVLQAITVITYDVPLASRLTDALVSIACSILTVALARRARNNHLAMEQVATTDELTGLRNRRGFDAVANLEIAIQRRYGGWFSLALVHLHDLGRFDDPPGQGVDVRALRLVGDILRRDTRASDLTAHLGADEFALLMPSTIESDGNVVCRKLAARIEQRMAEAGLRVGASLGCATFHRPPATLGEALAQAGRAMNAEKARRRAAASATPVA